MRWFGMPADTRRIDKLLDILLADSQLADILVDRGSDSRVRLRILLREIRVLLDIHRILLIDKGRTIRLDRVDHVGVEGLGVGIAGTVVRPLNSADARIEIRFRVRRINVLVQLVRRVARAEDGVVNVAGKLLISERRRGDIVRLNRPVLDRSIVIVIENV